MATHHLRIAAILAVLLAACWVARQIYQIIGSVTRARRNMAEARHSDRHQADIRMFLEAQTKLTRMDIQMGALFGVSLIALIAIAAHLFAGLHE
ncbi:hypothetical protein [Sphingomonas oryzagri]